MLPVMGAIGAGFKVAGGTMGVIGALQEGRDAWQNAKNRVQVMQYNLVGRQAELSHQSSLFESEVTSAYAQQREEDDIRQGAVNKAAAEIATGFAGRGLMPNSESFGAVQESLQRQAEEEAALGRFKTARTVSMYRMQRDEILTASANESYTSDLEQQMVLRSGAQAKRAAKGKAIGIGLSTIGSLFSMGS